MSIIYEILEQIKADNPNENLDIECENGLIKIINIYTKNSLFTAPINSVEISFEEFNDGSGVLRINTSKVLFVVNEEEYNYIDNKVANMEISNIEKGVFKKGIKYLCQRYGVTEDQLSVDIINKNQ